MNDGSSDDSLQELFRIQHLDTRVSIINLARNFGHQIAVTAGLDHARGDAVVIMDADLQDPPDVSLELIERWESGYDVVYAQRRTRKDTHFKRLTAKAFYILLDKLSDMPIPRDTGDFRLMSRRVVDEVNEMREHDRFLRGLVSWVGFAQVAVPFDRDERLSGTTSYTFGKMIKFATDGLLSFSTLPLKLITRLGLLLSTASYLGIIYALCAKIFFPSEVVSGWAFLTIIVLAIGGMEFIFLGILGSYLGRIYTQSQGRPLYVVESRSPRPTQDETSARNAP